MRRDGVAAEGGGAGSPAFRCSASKSEPTKYSTRDGVAAEGGGAG